MKFSQKPCKFYQNQCERDMASASIATEMSDGLRRLVEPVRAGENMKALIKKAASRAGMTYSRAFNLWYGRGKVTAEELERVRGLLRAKQQENIDADIAELRERLARLEEMAARRTPPVGHAPGG